MNRGTSTMSRVLFVQWSYGGSDDARDAGDLAYTVSHEALGCLSGRTCCLSVRVSMCLVSPDFGLVGPYDVQNCRGVPVDADVDAFSPELSTDIIFGSTP